MSDDDQPEFVSPAVQEAVVLHELFKAFMLGGFTENQALRLVSFYGTSSNDKTLADLTGDEDS